VVNVFISHAGCDTDSAKRIYRWLTGHKAFFDRHRHDGIKPGDDWEKVIFEKLRWADVVLCVVTEAYAASDWCAAEIGAARALGIQIIPVRLVDCEWPGLVKRHQGIDAVADREARKKLRDRLRDIDGAGGKGWTNGCPYPGLPRFERDQHAVFFGRKSEIDDIVSQLRSPGLSQEKILAVIGPSACGKSSLVRAGVLPRIAGEREWLCLEEPILPGSEPVEGLEREIANAMRTWNPKVDLDALSSTLRRPGGLNVIANRLLKAAGRGNDCKLLIVVDQFEELMTASEAERTLFADIVGPALGRSAQVLATLRPEFIEAVVTDPSLRRLPMRNYLVRPLTYETLPEVITKPANRAGLLIEDDLVAELVRDTGGGEALPLLAVTLNQLADGLVSGQEITRQRYEATGKVKGALIKQANAALDDAETIAKETTGSSRQQVIDVLLNLADIDDRRQTIKRRVPIADFKRSDTWDILQPFLNRRLLVTDGDDSSDELEKQGSPASVTVAHDALLRDWPTLANKITERESAFRMRRLIEDEAKEWNKKGKPKGLLWTDDRLGSAKDATGVEVHWIGSPTTQAGDSSAPAARRLLRPRLGRITTKLASVNQLGQEFLLKSIKRDRVKRQKYLVIASTIILVLAVLGGCAGIKWYDASIQKHRADDRLKQATALRLVAEGKSMLVDGGSGDEVRGIQQLLAAHDIAPEQAEGALLDAAVARRGMQKIFNAIDDPYKAALSSDGQHVVTADGTATVQVWALTGAPSGPPISQPTLVEAVALSPDGTQLVSGDASGDVTVWSVADGRPVHSILGEPGSVRVVAFSSDGQTVLAGGGIADSTLRIWMASTGQTAGQLVGHDGEVFAAAFSQDGRQVVSGGADGTVRLWDTANQKQIGQSMTGHAGTVTSVAFSQDGRQIVSGGTDGTVRLWDTANQKQIGQPMTGHDGAVTSVAFSQDGRQIVSGGQDGTVRLWDSTIRYPIDRPLTGPKGDGVLSVAFGAEPQRIASMFSDGTVREWDVRASELVGQPMMEESGQYPQDVAFSPDQMRVATASSDGTIQLWDATNGQPEGEALRGHEGAVNSLDFSPNGEQLASGGDDGKVRLWDVRAHRQIRTAMTENQGSVHSVAFSQDGRQIIAGGEKGRLRLWDALSNQPIGSPMALRADIVLSTAFSPNGRYVAAGGDDGRVEVFEAASGQTVGQPKSWAGKMVWSVAFNPDSNEVVASGEQVSDDQPGSGTVEGLVQIWHITGWPVGEPMTGHQGPVRTVMYSPSGHYIVSGDEKGTIRFWDTDGHSIGQPIEGYASRVEDVSFSNDEQYMFSYDWDGAIQMWPGPGRWREELCAKLTENMSRPQWRDWVRQEGWRQACPLLPTPDK
jgi:WD40 repeat protein